MLVLLQAWNYVMELYFWLILGAILVVSLTILLARPQRSEYEGEILDLGEAAGEGKKSDGIDVPETRIQKDVEEDEDPKIILPEEYTPEEIKKRWSIAFSFGGLTFTMFGGMVLWIGDGDFSRFLGSSMIYVGILSLLKGISFQISEERIIIRTILPILIFLINFFLLSVFLEVIGQTSWIERSNNGKAGDFFLVYGLPYLLWKIVPSFGNDKEEAKIKKPYSSRSYLGNKLVNLLPLNLKFIFFTYSLFWITNSSFLYPEIIIHSPLLRQYAKVGIDLGLDFLLINLAIRILISLKGSNVTRRNSDRAEFEHFRKKKNKEIPLAEDESIRDFSEASEDEYLSWTSVVGKEKTDDSDEVKE